eukprot:m.42395 g.42395  ORF g.42395 m.42395 type:complete len:711 (+) comp10685_c0_seq1:256-2388(+)
MGQALATTPLREAPARKELATFLSTKEVSYFVSADSICEQSLSTLLSRDFGAIASSEACRLVLETSASHLALLAQNASPSGNTRLLLTKIAATHQDEGQSDEAQTQAQLANALLLLAYITRFGHSCMSDSAQLLQLMGETEGACMHMQSLYTTMALYSAGPDSGPSQLVARASQTLSLRALGTCLTTLYSPLTTDCVDTHLAATTFLLSLFGGQLYNSNPLAWSNPLLDVVASSRAASVALTLGLLRRLIAMHVADERANEESLIADIVGLFSLPFSVLTSQYKQTLERERWSALKLQTQQLLLLWILYAPPPLTIGRTDNQFQETVATLNTQPAQEKATSVKQMEDIEVLVCGWCHAHDEAHTHVFHSSVAPPPQPCLHNSSIPFDKLLNGHANAINSAEGKLHFYFWMWLNPQYSRFVSRSNKLLLQLIQKLGNDIASLSESLDADSVDLALTLTLLILEHDDSIAICASSSLEEELPWFILQCDSDTVLSSLLFALLQCLATNWKTVKDQNIHERILALLRNIAPFTRHISTALSQKLVKTCGAYSRKFLQILHNKQRSHHDTAMLVAIGDTLKALYTFVNVTITSHFEDNLLMIYAVLVQVEDFEAVAHLKPFARVLDNIQRVCIVVLCFQSTQTHGKRLVHVFSNIKGHRTFYLSTDIKKKKKRGRMVHTLSCTTPDCLFSALSTPLQLRAFVCRLYFVSKWCCM